MAITKSSSREHNQNFFQLGTIQGAAVGLPGILFGGFLGAKYGSGVALCSLLAGNLVLWLIGLTIISMVFQSKINAVENIKNYLGKTGVSFAVGFLVLVFLAWFALQLNSSMSLLSFSLECISITKPGTVIFLGAFLGLVTAILSIGGIQLLKWVCVASAPLLVLLELWIFSRSTSNLSLSSFGFSASAFIAAVLLFLPGLINLPTFFRYSRSKADSCLGITLMMVYYTFFECTGIWIHLGEQFRSLSCNSFFVPLFLSVFLVALLFCGNLLNIYFSSACYENFLPRYSGTMGRFIMGILGTLAYVLIQIPSSIAVLIDLLNAYLAILGVVLMIAFLIRIIVKHRPRPKEELINTVVWLLGCFFVTMLKIQDGDNEKHFLLSGIGFVFLVFLLVIYVEETIWSTQKILSKKDR